MNSEVHPIKLVSTYELKGLWRISSTRPSLLAPEEVSSSHPVIGKNNDRKPTDGPLLRPLMISIRGAMGPDAFISSHRNDLKREVDLQRKPYSKVISHAAGVLVSPRRAPESDSLGCADSGEREGHPREGIGYPFPLHVSDIIIILILILIIILLLY